MKKNRKLIFVLLILVLIGFVFLNQIHLNYKYYTSNEGLVKMDLIFRFLDGFKREYGYIPDEIEFFEYIQSDSSFLYVNFPEFDFPDIKPEDFVITSNDDFIYVWLFSETKSNKDTAMIKNMDFYGFLFRKSHLVAQYSFPDPCRPELIYFEKNNVGIKNKILYNKIWKEVSAINDWLKERLPENNSSILCCYHIYFNEFQFNVEPVSFSREMDMCILDDELERQIRTRLRFLMDEYVDYDFYIQFYINENR